jgi:hypothetical protein
MPGGWRSDCSDDDPGVTGQAREAEEAGFASAWISDHYHPWIDRQGESPFVWCVIGAFAAGFDEVYISQVGDDQAGFFDFYQRELLPRLS